MLSTPHVIVGAAIATKIHNPILALPIAFCSHLVLEMVPHWNPHLNTEMRTHGRLTKQTMIIIVADTAIAAASGLFLAVTFGGSTMQTLNILGCSVAAITPDIMEAPYFFLHKKNKFLMMWLKFQKSLQSDAEVIPGLATQVMTMGLTLWWLFQ